jgi:hypothetical protein
VGRCGNVLDVHSEDSSFENGPKHRVSSPILFVVFLSPYWEMLGLFLKLHHDLPLPSATIRYQQFLHIPHCTVCISSSPRSQETFLIFGYFVTFPYILLLCVDWHTQHILASDTILQTGRSRVLFPMRSTDFSIDLILPSAL